MMMLDDMADSDRSAVMRLDCHRVRWFLAILAVFAWPCAALPVLDQVVTAKIDRDWLTLDVRVVARVGGQTTMDAADPAIRVQLPTDAQPSGEPPDGVTMPSSIVLSPGTPANVRYRLPIRSPTGVQRLGTADWLPHSPGYAYTLELTLTLPGGWHAVAQGRMTQHDGDGDVHTLRWSGPRPRRRLDLLAGAWVATERRNRPHGVRVLLLNDEPRLARTYLDAAERYLAFYSAALGPYPHDTFTLVENAEQTGWGMPGFTLMGSRVIRLPFIVHTSFAHEIVHNWWGNGVHAAGDDGNWTEGLTTYLADHWLRERRGKGTRFRRDALARFAVQARAGRDFPLARFRSRDSRTAQSVGYDKGMMVFHMLRREVGDEAFLNALRTAFADHLFDHLRLRDLVRLAGHRAADDFTAQWTTRTGAPDLRLDEAHLASDGTIRVSVLQANGDAPWDLLVPVQVLGADNRWRESRHRVAARTTTITIGYRAGDRGVALDPHHHVLRIPAHDEVPALIGDALDAGTATFMLGATPQRAAWLALATSLGGATARVLDAADQAPGAPGGVSIWLGGTPPWAQDADAALAAADARPGAVATALAWREPDGSPTLWLRAAGVAGIDRLARALPHYRRQSYVIHDTSGGRASAHGQWVAASRSTRRSLDGSDPTRWPQPPDPAPLGVPGLAHVPGAE